MIHGTSPYVVKIFRPLQMVSIADWFTHEPGLRTW